jgi:hypothetical protein
VIGYGMLFRELIFGRRSQFPVLAKATGFDFLCFPGDLDASMFTKMALEETVDIRADEGGRADNPIGGIIVFSIDIKSVPKFFTQWGLVGRFFRGHYRSQSGLNFDETSHSVEVIGFTTVMLLMFATILANALHQEMVLVKDYSRNTIYLVDKHPTSLVDLFKIKAKV